MSPERNFPKLDLTTFFLSISSAAFMGMGLRQDGDKDVDLELARQNIDLLELMQEKTRGNRTPDEDKLIEQLLFETRMRFVEVQRKMEHGKSCRSLKFSSSSSRCLPARRAPLCFATRRQRLRSSPIASSISRRRSFLQS